MKLKTKRYWLFVSTGTVAALLLCGCAWQIGGDKKGETVVQSTRGQELIDLKKARDQNAISEEEYQAQRQKVLNR